MFVLNLLVFDSEDVLMECGGVFVLMGLMGVGKMIIIVKLVVCCVMCFGVSKVVLLIIDSYWIGGYE